MAVQQASTKHVFDGSLVKQLREISKNVSEAKFRNLLADLGMKWGCYQFEGDDRLYCTACYDTNGLKSATNRLNTKFQQCPVCKAQIGP